MSSVILRGGIGDVPLGELIIRGGHTGMSSPAEIRLCPNGDIYVNGRLAANDREVVEGMRALLNLASGIQ